ncbi:MAG: hypothetical protein R2728_11230 [Chitinophagales bacterium]
MVLKQAPLLVAFFSAYEYYFHQLNWGSSYLVNDFYKRFLKKKTTNYRTEGDNTLMKIEKQIDDVSGYHIHCNVDCFWCDLSIGSISELGIYYAEWCGIMLCLILRWYWC